MRVLVAGATGHLGKHIVRQVKERGDQVRALVHDPGGLKPVGDATDEVFSADATDPDALAGCCDGVDAVISAIGLVGKGSKQTCWDVDFGANRNLLREAGRAGVGKFIYSSVVHAPALEKLQLVKAKRAFEQELRSSGLPFTILFPNGFFSDFDTYLRMARKGHAYVFGNGGFRINPIDGGDVAAAAIEALRADTGEIELGGPEILTHQQIARQAFDALGTPPHITHIPAGLLTTGTALMRRLTPLHVHGIIEFPLTVLTHDVVSPTTGKRTLAEYYRASVTAQPATSA